MMMTYLINTKVGIGNVSYQQAFNLQFIGFISPTPALIWEHFISVKAQLVELVKLCHFCPEDRCAFQIILSRTRNKEDRLGKENHEGASI